MGELVSLDKAREKKRLRAAIQGEGQDLVAKFQAIESKRVELERKLADERKAANEKVKRAYRIRGGGK